MQAIAQARLESQFERLQSLRKLLNLITGTNDLDLSHLTQEQQRIAAFVNPRSGPPLPCLAATLCHPR